MSWSTTLKNRQQIRAQMESGEEIAVMFSDIRGFTSYTARKGDHAAYRLSQLHEALLKKQIEERGGIIVKTMGDGIMAAFAEPMEGIQAAVKIQHAIRSHNKEEPEEPIDVGIGIASGTPIMTEADMIGHSVNLSQRVSSLAKGGQILVTEKIKESTSLSEDLHYLPMGERELKGLEAERLYEVAWMAEVSRLSDAKDHLTLVLTERGTVVIELAKEVQDEIARALEQLKSVPEKEGSALSAFLQRAIAGFTQKIIDKSLGAFGLAREHELGEIDLSLRGKDLIARVGRKKLSLEGVDPEAAAAFLEKLNAVKQRLVKPDADSEGR